MKFVIVIFALFAVAFTKPLDDPKNAVITRYDNDNIGIGGYNFGFGQSDGQERDEHAVLENAGTEDEGLKVEGSFKWVDEYGKEHLTTFIADRNGYKAWGTDIAQ